MTYNYNDEELQNLSWFQDFLNNNTSTGMLKIRAYSASEAVPVEGLNVIVSTLIDDNEVIFYEGYTDESGTIDRIVLPAPKISDNNLVSPLKTVYNIKALYPRENMNKEYSINMFEDVCVVQNINVVPDMSFNNEVM